MSEQVSGTHGRAEDDHLKRQDRSELEAQGELWPDPQSWETGAAEASWAPEGRFAGAGEDWQSIELRSDLARYLGRTAFPATRADLVQTLAGQQAEDRLVTMVSGLPPRARVGSLGELIRALGLPVEERGR
ncbi:MAG TPA: DUF2795 domain-containing protein [Streptosporangiaceae bacterium]|nr:DUF2795 domain-containing protein [Streptosporangiaceae bacterium]